MTITILNSETGFPRAAIGGRFMGAPIRISFGASEAYATGGLSITSALLAALGWKTMSHFIHTANGSDASLTAGEVKARLDTPNQKLLLYASGRTSTGTTSSSAVNEGTEVANATVINAMTLDGLAFGS